MLLDSKLVACVNILPGVRSLQIRCANAANVSSALLERLIWLRQAFWSSGVKSIYRWKGAIEEDDEQLLIIKTKEAALAKVVEVVKSNHSYDEPECIALPIMGGSSTYLKWLHDSMDS